MKKKIAQIEPKKKWNAQIRLHWGIEDEEKHKHKLLQKKRNFEYFDSGRNTQMLEEAKRDFLHT